MGKSKKKGGGGNKAPAKKSAAAASGSQQQPPQFATTPRSSTTTTSNNGLGIRRLLLPACIGYFFQKALRPALLYHGGAIAIPPDMRFRHLPVDPTNDSLQGKHGKLSKIYERLDEDEEVGEASNHKEPLMKGPETVVINPKDGTIYVLTEEALLVSLTDLKSHTVATIEPETVDANETPTTATILTAKATKVVDLGMGRPLGGRFTPDGETLYVCDAALGLLRITNPHQFPKAKVELVAHQFTMNDNTASSNRTVVSKIHYANDLAIGSKSGKVYFTDCTYLFGLY